MNWLLLAAGCSLVAYANSVIDTASTRSLCEVLTKPGVVFVGKVKGWSVVVENVLKGAVLSQAEYTLAKPLGRVGSRYLILADLPQSGEILKVIDAWDAHHLDGPLIRALQSAASGSGPKLFGSVRLQDNQPAGGLVPVFATERNGVTHEPGNGARAPSRRQATTPEHSVFRAVTHKTLTQPGGFFQFRDIPPGDYKITLGDAPATGGDVRVPSQGCASSPIWLRQNASPPGIRQPHQ